MQQLNEVYTQNGSLREPYARLQQRCGVDVSRPNDSAKAFLTNSPLGDELAILPVPLVLDDTEYSQKVQAGIHQRASALQAFFADLILGEQRILAADGPLDRDLIAAIFAEGEPLEYWRELWQGKSADQICFVYGPDLNRDENGEWVITEDNIGRIVGTGNAHAVLQAYLRAMKLQSTDPYWEQDDLQAGVRQFLRYRDLEPSDPAVAALTIESLPAGTLESAGRHHQRVRDALAAMGMQCWPIYQVSDAQKQRVLAGEMRALINMDIRSWKPKRQFYEKIFGELNTPLLEAPGVKLLCHKGLLPYVEDMIRFYLDEEPILRTQPTELMSSPELPTDGEWVIKECLGRSGDQVYILPRLQMQEREAVAQRLQVLFQEAKAEGRRPLVVRQRFLRPSYIASGPHSTWGHFLVELRPIAYGVALGKVHVSENAVARGTLEFGDVRNHISRGAFAVPVLRA